jgi:hypothetical protein
VSLERGIEPDNRIVTREDIASALIHTDDEIDSLLAAPQAALEVDPVRQCGRKP